MRQHISLAITNFLFVLILPGTASASQFEYVPSSSEIETTDGVLDVITVPSSESHSDFHITIRSFGEIEIDDSQTDFRSKTGGASYELEITSAVAGSYLDEEAVVTVLPALWGSITFRYNGETTVWLVSPGNWGSIFARVLFFSSFSTGHILLPLQLTSGSEDEIPVTVALSVKVTVTTDRQIYVDSIRLLDERGIGDTRVNPARIEDLLPAALKTDSLMAEGPATKKTFWCCYSSSRCKCYAEAGCPGVCPNYVETCGSPSLCFELGCPIECTN